jgi:hypothetical protein
MKPGLRRPKRYLVSMFDEVTRQTRYLPETGRDATTLPERARQFKSAHEASTVLDEMNDTWKRGAKSVPLPASVPVR